MAKSDYDSIREHLNIIFGEEKVQRIYKTMNSRSLSQASKRDMIQHNIPPRTAEKIQAIFHIRHAAKPPKGKIITQSSDAYELVKFLHKLDHEQFYIILLNQANRVIDIVKIGQGGTVGVVVDVKIIFRKAIQYKAAAMILVHNHPSGNTIASRQDIAITKKIKEAGKYMDIQVLDHIIVAAENNFTSMADEGLM